MTKSPIYDYVCNVCGMSYREVERCYEHIRNRHIDDGKEAYWDKDDLEKWARRHIRIRRRETQ